MMSNIGAEGMSSGFEILREGEVNYSKPLARALLRDSRLSFGARGLFAFLWDLPGGWRTNAAHLATMSPLGRDGVRKLLQELEAVGAMRDEAIRVKGGRLAGRRWVLVTPERWATESPLSIHKSPEAAPEASSTERRVFRSSVKPTVGKSNTKVHRMEGSSIKTTTNQAPVVEKIDEDAGGGVFKTALNPNPSAGTVHVFLDAAGNPEVLRPEIKKLSDEIAGASDDQAKRAGFAWRDTKKKLSPVGLAVQLCRFAASNTVTQCALAVTETKILEKEVVTQGFARLRGLHGKKYRTPHGKTARVDMDWIYLDDGEAIAGHDALACLRHIEEGSWQPLA